MATFPEYKEWFFTKAGQTLLPIDGDDSPVPQETPDASKSKEVGNVEIGTIFKENNQPNENNYQKLFNSLIFKLNSSDRAKDSTNNKSPKGDIKGGHVTLATNAEAIAKDNGVISKESRVPRVSQLPETVKGNNITSLDYSFDEIDSITNEAIDVERNVAVTTHSSYVVKLSDPFLFWLRDTINIIFDYIGTLLVTKGVVEIVNTSGEMVVEKTDETGIAAQQFKVGVKIPVSDDDTLAANSNIIIPSQKAVKTYVDNLLSLIADKADQSSVNDLANSITDLQNEKANQADLEALALIVDGKVSLTGDETIAGVKTFSSSPNVPNSPVGDSSAINKSYLDTRLSEYYKATEVDALIQTLQNQITILGDTITNLNTTITNLVADTYTKTQIDNKLDLKSDVTHNHDNQYHPKIVGTASGTYILKYGTNVNVNNGVITLITN